MTALLPPVDRFRLALVVSLEDVTEEVLDMLSLGTSRLDATWVLEPAFCRRDLVANPLDSYWKKLIPRRTECS